MKENFKKFLSVLYLTLFSVFGTLMALLMVGFWVFVGLVSLNWASLKYFNYSLFNSSLEKYYYSISAMVILLVWDCCRMHFLAFFEKLLGLNKACNFSIFAKLAI